MVILQDNLTSGRTSPFCLHDLFCSLILLAGLNIKKQHLFKQDIAGVQQYFEEYMYQAISDSLVNRTIMNYIVISNILIYQICISKFGWATIRKI